MVAYKTPAGEDTLEDKNKVQIHPRTEEEDAAEKEVNKIIEEILRICREMTDGLVEL